MDSLTQIVLGASVGEAVCGRRAGNKAVLWGAIAGTIPDLDVLARPFQDLVQELTFHRSITHSIFFAFLISPLLGWLLKRIYRNDATTFKDWTLLFFLCFITHALLDCFTTWGTKVFYPFSDYAVSFQNIFVIDPLYTIPFLICVIAVLFYHRTDNRRRYWNYIGLTISTAYIGVTFINKYAANRVFEANLKEQNINYTRYSSRPTPFNTILWGVTAEADSGYYLGYYSLLDKNKEVNFKYLEKDHHLLKPYRDNKKVRQLIDVTEGYYTIDKADSALLMNDLRFGQLDGWGEGKEDFVFEYVIQEENGKLRFSQQENNLKKVRALMEDLWDRILGEE